MTYSMIAMLGITSDLFGIVDSTFDDTMKSIKTARESADHIANRAEELGLSFEEHEVGLCLSSFKSL
jgi:hypothetical protein